MGTTIGFDIGGSTIRAGLVTHDKDGWRVEARQRRVLDADTARTPEAIVTAVVEMVSTLARGWGPWAEPASISLPIGIGFPAQIGPRGRTVVRAPNLGWEEVRFVDLLQARLPAAEIRLENDLSAILLGEQRFGAGVGCTTLVAIYPGTGLGGAAMVEGRLVRGMHGFAGEIGHVKLGGSRRCGCGQVGCAETHVGGRYINAQIREGLAEGRFCSPAFAEYEEVGLDEVDAAFAQGDPDAVALFSHVADVLSQLAATAVALLNPEMVLLGGGVMEHAPNLRRTVQEQIVARSPEVAREGLQVRMGTLGDDAGLLGAAALVSGESG